MMFTTILSDSRDIDINMRINPLFHNRLPTSLVRILLIYLKNPKRINIDMLRRDPEIENGLKNKIKCS